VHELSIAQSVVERVTERAAGRQVVRVRLRVGRLSGVVPDALRFSFDLVTEGTSAQGAVLEIEEPEGRACCRTCAADFVLRDLVLLCECGSADVELLSGSELMVSSMEVA
jgi:hydrogenase nickel incorporation protein HypA/HybF